MFIRQLSSLALSALVAVSPVSFEMSNEIQYPYTRTDHVYYVTSFSVYDVGYQHNVDLATISSGLEAQTEDAPHSYVINYTFDVFCSSACSLAIPDNSSSASVSSDHWSFTYSQTYNAIPNVLVQRLSGVQRGGNTSQVNTYNTPYSMATVALTAPILDGSQQFYVRFPASNEGMLLQNIDYNLDDFKFDYEIVNYKALIYRLVLDKDIPSETKQTVLQYINNGDYSTAYEYVENYYNDNSVTETEYNETVINQYESKETDLQTLTDTENQFSIGIENDFNQRMQNISTENNITTLSPFVTSANWVKEQFDRLTVNTVFGSTLTFALLVGLAMALIGRIL